MKMHAWPANCLQLLFGRKPECVPPFAWRKVWPLRLVARTMMVTVLVYIGTLLIVYSGLLHYRIAGGLGEALFSIEMFLASICVSYLVLVTAILTHSRWRAVVRVCRVLGWAMCEQCGYDLRGLPERHTCPECGKQYDLNRTRAHWRAMEGASAKQGNWTMRPSGKFQWVIVVAPLALALLAVLVLSLKGCR